MSLENKLSLFGQACTLEWVSGSLGYRRSIGGELGIWRIAAPTLTSKPPFDHCCLLSVSVPFLLVSWIIHLALMGAACCKSELWRRVYLNCWTILVQTHVDY